MTKTIFLLTVGAAALAAQEQNERITVPLSDPSRPGQVRVSLMSGSITVRGHQGKEILIDTHARAGERRAEVPRRADGLKRVDLGATMDLDVEESNNSVTVHAKHSNRSQDLVISVPANTSLNLKTMNNGEIVVEGVNGELAVNNMNGKVTLRNVSGTVLANSMNGDVSVVLDRVDPNKPNSFSTMNGDIDVAMPADVKTRVKLKANNGEVYSDFDIKGDGNPAKPTIEQGRGRYKVKFDQATYGTINGGGPEFQFSTFNGNILIRKK